MSKKGNFEISEMQNKMNQNHQPPNSDSNNQPQEVHRQNPNLLRINADNQDKKQVCIFWSIFFALIVIIACIGFWGLPDTFVKINRSQQLSGTDISTCSNPSNINSNNSKLECNENFPTDSNLGEVVRDAKQANQYGFIFLDFVPTGSTSDTLNQQITLQTKQLYQRQISGVNSIYVLKNISSSSGNLQFSIDNSDNLYSENGKQKIGFTKLIGVLKNFDGTEFLARVLFSNSAQFSSTSSGTYQITTYVVNSDFTIFTIVIRYVYFIFAIISASLYIFRYIRVPETKRIIQQKLIFVASILLIMFNDPLFPVTILYPNGFSSFLSLVFIINLFVFVIYLWLTFFDRIYYEEGRVQTEMDPKKKMIYCLLLFVQLIVLYMIYAMENIEGVPLVFRHSYRKYFVASIIIGLTLACGIAYILFRMFKICFKQYTLQRNNLFINFSFVFILAGFIAIVSNSISIFYMRGASILVIYTFTNVYIFYLQFMYSVPSTELVNVNGDNSLDYRRYEAASVMSSGTIDIVDIDLRSDDDKIWNQGKNGAKNHNQFGEFNQLEDEFSEKIEQSKEEKQSQKFDF